MEQRAPAANSVLQSLLATKSIPGDDFAELDALTQIVAEGNGRRRTLGVYRLHAELDFGGSDRERSGKGGVRDE